MAAILRCPICGEPWRVKNVRTARTCSATCRKAAQRKRQRGEIVPPPQRIDYGDVLPDPRRDMARTG